MATERSTLNLDIKSQEHQNEAESLVDKEVAK